MLLTNSSGSIRGASPVKRERSNSRGPGISSAKFTSFANFVDVSERPAVWSLVRHAFVEAFVPSYH